MRSLPCLRIRLEAIAFALMVSLALPLRSEADARIEGMVRDTVVTHCDASRQGGCAGTLRLERPSTGDIETVTIKVPLGTPISRGVETVLLHSLEGQRVLVTQVWDGGARVARAVEVADPEFAAPLAHPGLRDLC